MHGKRNQLIDGNARVVDEDHINVTIRKEDIEKLKSNQTGQFLKLHLKRRYKPDKFENTHVVVSGHCRKLTPKDDIQPGYVDNKGKSTLD